MNKLLLLLAVCINTHSAALESLDDYFELSLQELLQIKVTGPTLTPTSLKSVPAAVTVFSHAEINRLGLDTLDELMNLVPGFQSYRSNFSLMEYPFSARGRRIGDAASEILVMVDGQRLDTPQNSGSAQIVPRFNLANIERVEFIRGPGAAIYGSNAMMGVINIITRAGHNELSLQYGSFNRRQALLFNTWPMGTASLDTFVQLEVDDGEHYWVQDTFAAGNIQTDDPRQVAQANLKWHWQDSQIGVQHHEFEATNFYELSGLANDFNRRVSRFNALWGRQNFNWLEVNSNVWLSHHEATMEFNAQLTGPGALTSPYSDPSSDEPLRVKVKLDNYNESRLQWHNDLSLSDDSSVQFGLEFRHIIAPSAVAYNSFNLAQLAANDFPITSYQDFSNGTVIQLKSSRDITGLYGQYQAQLFTASHLTLGLRYDDFSHLGSQLSPRLAWVQELGEHHSIKFLYGEAFRAPTEDELNLVNNPTVLGNPNLKAETVHSWDVIFFGQYENSYFSFGYFENHFDDAIVVDESGLLQLKNIDMESIKGLEMEVSHQLNDQWLWRTSVTHISEKPDISLREAKQLASFMVNFQQGRYNANLIAMYHGTRDMPIDGGNTDFITLPSYWQLFFKSKFSFSEDLQGFIQVKNLLDENYLTPVSNSDTDEGLVNRSQEILVGFHWQY